MPTNFLKARLKAAFRVTADICGDAGDIDLVRNQQTGGELHALGRDEHPDVANHTRTWQYYGMWQLEQGNRLKAEEHLETIASICGTGCEDYRSLKLALAGGGSY